MLSFMIFMLPIGIITSPDINGHIEQWITSLEYMFMMVVISSVIKHTDTDTFHIMLLIISVILSVIFLRAPVFYAGGGRYSISREVNPNGLGMTFTTGIWVALYLQHKKNIPVIIPLIFVSLLMYSITKTGSRKALIAAGIIVILWFVFGYVHKSLQKKNKWKIVFNIITAIVLFYLGKEFLRIYAGSDIEARMGGLENEVTSGMRSSMYINGWKHFIENPIFGIGFQGFRYYHGGYSHATLVEVPVSGGIIGCILYFGAYIISIKKCFSLYKFCKNRQELSKEVSEITMILILWIAMLFYCTCVIHPYQFNSCVAFGIIFGQSACIEMKLQKTYQDDMNFHQEKKCRWIKS